MKDNHKVPKETLDQIELKLRASWVDLLADLGIEPNPRLSREHEVRCMAPCHGGDNPTGFTFYTEVGCWKCWTNQCHVKYGGGLIGLVWAVKRCSFKEAIDYCQAFVKDRKVDLSTIPTRVVTRKLADLDVWRQHLTQKSFTDSCLSRLKPCVGFCNERGLSAQSLHDRGIGFATTGIMANRIVVPVRNINGQIIGFSGRWAHPNRFDHIPKWRHHGFQSSINLFNIEIAKEHTDKTKSLIVVESPWDVIKLEMAGYKNAVAMFGTNLADGQVDLLSHMSIMSVVLLVHADEAGHNGHAKNVAKLERRLFNVYTLHPETGCKDADEMSVFQIRKLLKGINI